VSRNRIWALAGHQRSGQEADTEMRAFALPLLLCILAPACASPQSRLTTGLQEAGLSSKQSRCMADDMAGKLSIGQLLKLSSLGKAKGRDLKTVSTKQFLHDVCALGDPEIISITTRAALGCALSG
jgi:hypothetical protein